MRVATQSAAEPTERLAESTSEFATAGAIILISPHLYIFS